MTESYSEYFPIPLSVLHNHPQSVIAIVLEASSSAVASNIGSGTSLGIEPTTYLHSLRPLRTVVIFWDHA